MARKKTRNPHVGSDFESFLAEDGQLEATTAVAITRYAPGVSSVRVDVAVSARVNPSGPVTCTAPASPAGSPASATASAPLDTS